MNYLNTADVEMYPYDVMMEYTEKEIHLYNIVCSTFMDFLSSQLPAQDIYLLKEVLNKVILFLKKLEEHLQENELQESDLFLINCAKKMDCECIYHIVTEYLQKYGSKKSVPVLRFLKDETTYFEKEEQSQQANPSKLVNKVLNEVFRDGGLINDDIVLGNISNHYNRDFAPPMDGFLRDFEGYKNMLSEIEKFLEEITTSDSDEAVLKYLENQLEYPLESFCEMVLEQLK